MTPSAIVIACAAVEVVALIFLAATVGRTYWNVAGEDEFPRHRRQ